MKKTIALLLTTLSLFSTDLKAVDINFNDIGSTQINPPTPAASDDCTPFIFQIDGDWVGRAKVRRCPTNHHLKFYEGEVDLGGIYYYCPCYSEGATISLSYTRCRMDLNHNCLFHQKNFNALSLNLGGFSERLENWLWKGQVSFNIDPEHWDFNEYMNYDFLLWGRYNYCQDIGLHIGFIGYTGMKIDRVYPIIGVDWQYDCNWKFNFVFPVNISAVYSFNDCWSVAFALRAFETRYRTGKNENLSRALFLYRAAGAEIGLNYKLASWISANIHAGGIFGGTLKIANRHYRQRHKYRFESAPYVGGQLVLLF